MSRASPGAGGLCNIREKRRNARVKKGGVGRVGR
jgi:hypothetical protein